MPSCIKEFLKAESWNIFFQLKTKIYYNKENYTRFMYNKIITITVFKSFTRYIFI